ncbi:MAG TPA: hypothetical protein VM509_12730 [Planctomycetota bacterium]|nr:hypothetical protein [Planctomycetota bacterium]
MQSVERILVALALATGALASCAVVRTSLDENPSSAQAAHPQTVQVHSFCGRPQVAKHGDEVVSTTRIGLSKLLTDPESGQLVRQLSYWVTWTRDRALLAQAMGTISVPAAGGEAVSNELGGIDPSNGANAPQANFHKYRYSITPLRPWGEIRDSGDIKLEVLRLE